MAHILAFLEVFSHTGKNFIPVVGIHVKPDDGIILNGQGRQRNHSKDGILLAFSPHMSIKRTSHSQTRKHEVVLALGLHDKASTTARMSSCLARREKTTPMPTITPTDAAPQELREALLLTERGVYCWEPSSRFSMLSRPERNRKSTTTRLVMSKLGSRRFKNCHIVDRSSG